jgi:xanthine dehydrogenase YagR molybdenum-binding subunit
MSRSGSQVAIRSRPETLGICGAGAAVGNAVFSATGVRVRDLPITLDKLLPHLPAQEF